MLEGPLRSCLCQWPVVEPPVEPILVAGNVVRHRDVEERIEQWYTRNIGEGQANKTFDLLLVFLWILFESGGLDHLVHRRVLIRHRVEERVLPVIIPEEEILGGPKPTTEEIDDHRQRLLGQLGTPIGSRYLVQREFDADLPEAFLDQHAN